MRANQMPNDSFVGFKDYEIQRMERNLLWMKEPKESKYIQEQRADFYRFFNEYDKRDEYMQTGNLGFLNVFPQMREFWQECKYHAEQ
jgi:hypothetical protein